VVNIPEITLVFHLRRGLYNRGSLDAERTGYVLLPHRHTPENMTCADRWHHYQSQQHMNEAELT